MTNDTSHGRRETAAELLRQLIADLRDATHTDHEHPDHAAALAEIRGHVAPICGCRVRDYALLLAAGVIAQHEWDGDVSVCLHPAGRKRRHLEVVTSHA